MRVNELRMVDTRFSPGIEKENMVWIFDVDIALLECVPEILGENLSEGARLQALIIGSTFVLKIGARPNK